MVNIWKDRTHPDVRVLGGSVCTVMPLPHELEAKDDATRRSACHFHRTIHKKWFWPLLRTDRRTSVHTEAEGAAETMRNEEAEDPLPPPG